jgi:3-oxoacyl-[acyl-carrier-protein] synthase-3
MHRMLFASKIAGTGSYLPERILTNQDLEKTLDTSDQWILERTGISERHIGAPNESTSDIALPAALKAIESSGLQIGDLDAILVATATPDQILPSTSCFLQDKLKCPSIMALDIAAACSGFLYGMSIADQFIRTGMYRNVLIVGAEKLSSIINYQDRQTCILFGDGAGAVVLSRATEADSTSRVLSTHLHAAGELGDLLTVPGGGSRLPISQRVLDENLHYVHMKGREIFKNAVRTLADRCREALQTNGMTVADVKWFIAHQANLRIIEAVADQVGLDRRALLVNVAKTGNTSSASIPILLDQEVRKGTIQRGDLVLTAAFGAGLTSASALFRF